MTRWMQLGAFSPVFRSHEGNLPDQSLQVYSN
jgi:alpha-glucosidase